jgi:hypothetical protein
VLLLVFWRGNEREEEAVQQKQSEEEEEEWHLRRLLRTLPNETRDRAVQTIVEKRRGTQKVNLKPASFLKASFWTHDPMQKQLFVENHFWRNIEFFSRLF